MLNVFTLENGRLAGRAVADDEPDDGAITRAPVWVDLEAPTAQDKAWVERRYGLVIPSDAVDDDLEESARFYEEPRAPS